ncbi:UNVERIFIED_CONTAM: hypothetical protein Sangu_3050700, partial [Sesamum angustifolium]
MSDKQKGLIQAFEEVFPGCDHRFCVRHLHNNFKNAGYRGLAFKTALWNAARACTVGEWKMRMQEMKKISESARDWFNDKPEVPWSQSHFSETSQCDMLLNNVCETFNYCIIDAREKPILTMLEWIREYIMRRMQENRDRSNTKWKEKLCPKIQQILQKHALRTCGEPGHNTAKCPEREGETRSTLDQRASKKAVESKVGKRKAVDNIIEDNSNEIEHGGSSGTQYPNILPPLHTEAEPTPEACITQQETVSQPPAVPVYKAGPSMYEQLSMSNKHMTLQSRVQIRAPPPMIGPQRIPVFSSVSRAQSGTIKPIITEGGQKYLDLSQFSFHQMHIN